MKCAGHQKSATPFTVKLATDPLTGPNSLKRFSVVASGCYQGDSAFFLKLAETIQIQQRGEPCSS
jgi:hypothetical protein